MLRALSSTFDDATGRRFKGNYFVAKDDSTHPFNYFWWDAIYAELSSGRPLLAAYRTGPTTGHAVVVTHIRVRRYPDRRPDLLQMTVRDPWPQNPNRRQLELSEILALRFIAAVSVKRIHG